MASDLKKLEILLDRLEGFAYPKPKLEQWRTPGRIAVEAAVLARVQNKSVLDLGCGTGILAISSALLNAKSVTGVDIDPSALEIAKRNAEAAGVEIEWVQADALEWGEGRYFDKVLMNPPFDFKKDLDIAFVRHALDLADEVYALLSSRGRNIWLNEFRTEVLRKFRFPLKRQFWFPKHKASMMDLDLVRFW